MADSPPQALDRIPPPPPAPTFHKLHIPPSNPLHPPPAPWVPWTWFTNLTLTKGSVMKRILVAGLPLLLWLGLSGVATAAAPAQTDKTASPYFFVEGASSDDAFPLK